MLTKNPNEIFPVASILQYSFNPKIITKTLPKKKFNSDFINI